MASVTDPDDLDRWQVLIDPTNETIKVKGLGADKYAVFTTGSGFIGQTFEDVENGNFVASGISAGDILSIASGDSSINHYTVSGSITSTSMAVSPSFSANENGLTYKISAATPVVVGANGGTVSDGVALQALYSFNKEEWRTLSEVELPDLIQFDFPFISITREQFELGGSDNGNWDFADDDTRNLIRTGGWAKKDTGGTTQAEYTGIITLGTLDDDAQVYYLQSSSGTPSNFVLTGPVNQAIKTFTNGGDDFRGFLKLFVRKKGKSYAGSEIADIGVTAIETIVNRFPLAHIDDAAILKSDGELIGETPFQAVTNVDTGSDGVSSDPDTTDGLFTFTSAGSTFVTDGLEPGDVLQITSVTDQGTYEIQSVSGETTLILFQEPGDSISGGSSLNFTTKTRIRYAEVTNVTTANVDDATGTVTSSGATFSASGVVAGDMAVITAGDSSVVGAYKVVSVDSETQLTLNTADQILTAQTNQTMTVYRPGMHLQYKSVDASSVSGVNITFAADGGGGQATITRASGDFTSDGYVHGMVVTVTGASTAGNNGRFTIDTVTSTVLTLIPSAVLIDEGPSAGVTLNGNVGFVRTLNQVDYSFNWRLFGNGGTLAECFQWIQRALRRGTDIDESDGTSRGDITDLLMAFSTPTGTTTNMFIDDLASSDANNATFRDEIGTARNFAFIAGVTITLSSTLTDDSSAKVVVFFTDADGTPSSGDEFGTTGAIIVQDTDTNPMQSVSPLTSPLSFQYDYDNNSQGGRTPGTNAAVTIVGIGLDSAQYVQVTGTIQRQNENVFALVSALERNYSNPS